MKISHFAIVCIWSILCSCAPTKLVAPLEQGQAAAGASLGGPLIGFAGTTIPIPFTSVSGYYGFNDNTTGFGAIYPTAISFGVMQADIGVLYGFLRPQGWIPGISGSAQANMMFDIWENQFRLYPQLDLNAYWNYGKKNNLIYTGISNWFDPATEKAHEQHHAIFWVPNFQLGHIFVNPRWDFILEAKYLAPFHQNPRVVVDYRNIGNRGAIGVYFGIIRKF
jgi:hypothetical protein